MTGYTVHTGSNDKFREGWSNVFKKKKTKKQAAASKSKKEGKKKS